MFEDAGLDAELVLRREVRGLKGSPDFHVVLDLSRRGRHSIYSAHEALEPLGGCVEDRLFEGGRLGRRLEHHNRDGGEFVRLRRRGGENMI